jgi:PII-like signaling protein
VSDGCLKLTIYFGERDRADGEFLADALSSIYARHGLQSSLVMRGIDGFGIKHHLHTDRQLTLSEDLPMVSIAVDARARIDAALEDVKRLRFDGLVTLERAQIRIAGGSFGGLAAASPAETKLTVYVGRHERAEGKPAYEAVVELFHAHEFAGAAVLLGVDGTAAGNRRRARFFGANAGVPLMVIGVGERAAIEELLPALHRLVPHAIATTERVQVCKRDGARLREPSEPPSTDSSGLAVWQKLMVFVDEDARVGGHSLQHQLIRELRLAGAAGATSLRGIWGFDGQSPPHGDSFWQLGRRVPTLTVVVDTPDRVRRWFDTIDRLTQATGVVTSELVPAFRATGPNLERGGLNLAPRRVN